MYLAWIDAEDKVNVRFKTIRIIQESIQTVVETGDYKKEGLKNLNIRSLKLFIGNLLAASISSRSSFGRRQTLVRKSSVLFDVTWLVCFKILIHVYESIVLILHLFDEQRDKDIRNWFKLRFKECIMTGSVIHVSPTGSSQEASRLLKFGPVSVLGIEAPCTILLVKRHPNTPRNQKKGFKKYLLLNLSVFY